MTESPLYDESQVKLMAIAAERVHSSLQEMDERLYQKTGRASRAFLLKRVATERAEALKQTTWKIWK